MVRFRFLLVEISSIPTQCVGASSARIGLKRNINTYACFLARPAVYTAFRWTLIYKTKNTPQRRVFVLVEISGFEPLASSLRTRRSTNWAISPKLFHYKSFFICLSTIFCGHSLKKFKKILSKNARLEGARYRLCIIPVYRIYFPRTSSRHSLACKQDRW